MTYITTFDTVFWTTVALTLVFFGYTYFFNKHYVSVIIKVIENVSYKWFVGLVTGVMTVIAIGFFIWSPQGMVTSMFWSTIAMLFLYKPYAALNAKIVEMGLENLDKLLKEKELA